MLLSNSLRYLAFMLLCFLLLVFSRVQSNYDYKSEKVIFSTPVSNPFLLLGSAGFAPGLSADFQVLSVFSVQDRIKRTGKHAFYPLLAVHLKNASILDPRFFDTYRLSSSFLVYDANMPNEAVSLLSYASQVLEDNWEFPFFGGVVAYEFSKDYEQAFYLMSLVLERPHAPALAVNLATNYLSQNQTAEEVLLFLYVQKKIMPKKYQASIEKKIQQFKMMRERDLAQ